MKSCKDRIDEQLKNRIEDLRKGNEYSASSFRGSHNRLRIKKQNRKVRKWIWWKNLVPELRIPVYQSKTLLAESEEAEEFSQEIDIYRPTGRGNPKDGFEYEYKGTVV